MPPGGRSQFHSLRAEVSLQSGPRDRLPSVILPTSNKCGVQYVLAVPSSAASAAGDASSAHGAGRALQPAQVDVDAPELRPGRAMTAWKGARWSRALHVRAAAVAKAAEPPKASHARIIAHMEARDGQGDLARPGATAAIWWGFIRMF